MEMNQKTLQRLNKQERDILTSTLGLFGSTLDFAVLENSMNRVARDIDGGTNRLEFALIINDKSVLRKRVNPEIVNKSIRQIFNDEMKIAPEELSSTIAIANHAVKETENMSLKYTSHKPTVGQIADHMMAVENARVKHEMAESFEQLVKAKYQPDVLQDK